MINEPEIANNISCTQRNKSEPNT